MKTHRRHRLRSSKHVEITLATLHRWIFANVGVADMKEHFVIDPLISKRQQLMLATQLCRMVLKVRYLFASSLLITLHMYPSFLISTPISSLSSHPMPNHYHTHRSLRTRVTLSPLPVPSTASHLLHKARRKHDGITTFPMCTLLHTLLIRARAHLRCHKIRIVY